jgi:2-polyprenyl-3-methyl-5-hydroxy-6-metoxy-1,4-benzoquinol methylase
VTSAGRRAIARYAGASRSTRVHTKLRWWWCPFPAIEAEVPRDGDVLELGCGHGLLSLYLALAAPSRRVRGVDIDAEKIAEARSAGADLATFDAVPPGFVPDEPCDAVVVADVLYLLPAEEQRRIVEAAANVVRPGGVVVLKEMGLAPRWKARWNRFQETMATRVVKITEHTGAGLNFVDPEEMAGWLRDAGLDASVRRVDNGYLWPHALIVARKASTSLGEV